MRKLLIFIAIIATAGCSTVGDGLRSLSGVTDIIPNALDRAPLIYRPTIQQGNVVTQEQVNELQPGMTKRQVKFVLGTPMISDIFHVDRWDYAFTRGVGSRPTERQQVTVFFENDRLIRIAGDMRPQPEAEREEVKKEIVVSVPDWEPKDKTLFRRAMDLVGVDSVDE